MKPKMTLRELSVRWTHAEREGILTDRLGHGDISHWASGTSKPFGTVFSPKRPNENKLFDDNEPAVRVRKLANVRPLVKRPDNHNGHDMQLIGQHVTDNAAQIMAHRHERIVPIVEKFAAHYKATVQRVGHEMKEAAIELEAIPQETLSKWLKSKGAALSSSIDSFAGEALAMRKAKGLYVR